MCLLVLELGLFYLICSCSQRFIACSCACYLFKSLFLCYIKPRDQLSTKYDRVKLIKLFLKCYG